MITMHARTRTVTRQTDRRTDRRTNIMTIARRFVLTNALRAKNDNPVQFTLVLLEFIALRKVTIISNMAFYSTAECRRLRSVSGATCSILLAAGSRAVTRKFC